jgi:hypothetical protein
VDQLHRNSDTLPRIAPRCRPTLLATAAAIHELPIVPVSAAVRAPIPVHVAGPAARATRDFVATLEEWTHYAEGSKHEQSSDEHSPGIRQWTWH